MVRSKHLPVTKNHTQQSFSLCPVPVLQLSENLSLCVTHCVPVATHYIDDYKVDGICEFSSKIQLCTSLMIEDAVVIFL